MTDPMHLDPATLLPTLYKITGPNGEPIHGGSGQWDLPKDGKPGAWWDLTGPIEPCRNALHVTDAAHLDRWYDDRAGYGGAIIHRVEVRGVIINAGDKYAVSSARLLPHAGGPSPDVAAAEAEYEAIRAKADRAYARAIRKAARATGTVKVSPAWRSYVEAVGAERFPKDHPAHAYAAAIAEQRKAERAAEQARLVVIGPAQRRLIEVRASARLAGI